MKPSSLIGIQYRLGSSPTVHGTADCFSLARAVVEHYGGVAPRPEREWYRRLKRGDYSVFQEELEKWGEKIESPKVGSVALCRSDGDALGLAAYYEEEPGWIAFVNQTATWKPIEGLAIESIYCPRSAISASNLESVPETTSISFIYSIKPEKDED